MSWEARDVAVRNVVWIASYPKSGNTWMTSAVMLAARQHGEQRGPLDAYVAERDGDVPGTTTAVRASLRDHPCSVLKTHSAYSPAGQPHRFPGLTLRTVARVHVYRNPLDVLLSYIGYTRLAYRANQGRPGYAEALFLDLLGFDRVWTYEAWLGQGIDTIPQRHLDHALDRFSEDGLSIGHLQGLSGSWTDHAESWRVAAAGLPGCSLRYEDCVQDVAAFDPVAELFEFDAKALRDAVLSVNGRARKLSREGTADQAIFYSKMRAYYFPEYFSRPAISRFCARNEATLRRFGYQAVLEMA